MYFKKLELIGFKSFFDKTALHFEPGITAVVGPNGCGKSNIFDSIRWVLGEQSAKSLRGSEMQDVIFNGTDQKEPLGMAEVSLTFDNQKRFFNLDHPELTITRRLFRSGESEYLMNKAQVRLKDITDLLLGTGIGAESYSIIAQGKIDLVLSSKPEERRQVLDEASGITKYKAQKREACRRLEETEQNLARVSDIIAEVKRQIGSLERQAAKARRYQEVFEQLKSKELELALGQRQALLSAKDAAIRQLCELQSKEVQLLNSLREQEARIAGRQQELKALEEELLSLKNQILGLENSVVRNSEQANFVRQRLEELKGLKNSLLFGIEQSKIKVIAAQERVENTKAEYQQMRRQAEEKAAALSAQEAGLSALAEKIKQALGLIASCKVEITQIAAQASVARNEVNEISSQRQIYLARQKRLEIEKAKAFQEHAIAEEELASAGAEVAAVKSAIGEVAGKLGLCMEELRLEGASLEALKGQAAELEKRRISLESQREFLEKVKSNYEGMAEVMNAVVYLDKMPQERLSGLVIKVKDAIDLQVEGQPAQTPSNFRLSGEAKPVELDTGKIEERLAALDSELAALSAQAASKQELIDGKNKAAAELQAQLHNAQLSLANKEAACQTALAQFNEIKEEEDIIVIELTDVGRELAALEGNANTLSARLQELARGQRLKEDSILKQEEEISQNNRQREELLVGIAGAKSELSGLGQRIASYSQTMKIIEDSCSQEKDALFGLEEQLKDSQANAAAYEGQLSQAGKDIEQAGLAIREKQIQLEQAEGKYRQSSAGSGDFFKGVEDSRAELDGLRARLYQLQMEDKDIDYKYAAIKERMLQAYKIELEAISGEAAAAAEGLEEEINSLKAKLDSYGMVNLVAIEEYDELKKRYDFLLQQQNDLLSAKESLHQAILKLNRTTRQMFLETFEKVREEFRNYFRLLFNGGDAQLFLIDESDPLESGIEIIARPPGKKLQNVLLLSGGERSLSAIALIFAIFKVKPSPFCILDEIDAALDEANVDRFARILQDFAETSQFIVVTHNKKTIANADVMYGITMEQSGISKIVSVKFAREDKVASSV
jgi:chromosome segregation protein